MKSRQLIAAPLVASLLAAGPGLSAARAAGGVYHARNGAPIAGLSLRGWAGAPLLRGGYNLRSSGIDPSRSIASLIVTPAPGIKTAPTLAAPQVPLGLFAAAERMGVRLAQHPGLLALRDVHANGARRLSAASKIYDNATAPEDSFSVLGGFSRTRGEGVRRLSPRDDKSEGASGRRAPVEMKKAGPRKRRGEIGRGLALFAGAAAMLGAGLYGLSFSMPRLLPLLGQGSLCLLTIAGAAGVIAALVIARNRLRSHIDGYRRLERRDVLSWGAGLLGSGAALGGGLYGLHVWAPQYLPAFAKFGLVLLTAAGAGAVFLTLLMAYEWLTARVKDRRAERKRDEAPKSGRTLEEPGEGFDWGAVGRVAAIVVAIAAVGGGAYGLYLLAPGPVRLAGLIFLFVGGFAALLVLAGLNH